MRVGCVNNGLIITELGFVQNDKSKHRCRDAAPVFSRYGALSHKPYQLASTTRLQARLHVTARFRRNHAALFDAIVLGANYL